jgi:predicted transcriptional regulator of viral defense system
MKFDSLLKYIESLHQAGRYSFLKSEAAKALEVSDAALKLSLARLCAKKKISSVRRGFYVIVPLEYALSGILPPDWFIDDLMKFLNKEYYVGLLSAAAIHGVAHQQPQEFQVIVPIHIRSIHSHKLRIRFFKKKGMRQVTPKLAKTATGYIKISDCAQTMLDLVVYSKQIGGLDTILPIIKELSESVTGALLLTAAQNELNLAYVQRLGALLDKIDRVDLTNDMSKWLESKKPKWTPLDPSLPRKGMPRNARWCVIENIEIESEA